MVKQKKSKKAQVAGAGAKVIKMITKTYTLNVTLYLLTDTQEKMISKAQYDNIIGYRGLMESIGGKERYYKGYNTKGELIVNKIISTSPDKTDKVYRYFIF